VTPAASRSAAAPTPTSSTGGGVSLSLLLLIALAGVGTLLVVVAVLPARLAPEFMREFYVEPERRIALFSLTLAILFVLFISLYFR
jgi:hypothetical protein